MVRLHFITIFFTTMNCLMMSSERVCIKDIISIDEDSANEQQAKKWDKLSTLLDKKK